MFRVKVVGEYIARSGVMQKEKIKKSYEIEGNIPTMTAALSIVKNKLLHPALTKKYPDYVTFLTYNIIEITPLTEAAKTQMSKSEVSFMDRSTLMEYIKNNNIPVDAAYYPNLFRLREAVQFAKDDPKGYEKQFSLREADLRLDLDMAKCNPDLFEKPDTASFAGAVDTNILKPKEGRSQAGSPKAHVKNTGDRLAGLKGDMARSGELGPEDTDSPDAGDL